MTCHPTSKSRSSSGSDTENESNNNLIVNKGISQPKITDDALWKWY